MGAENVEFSSLVDTVRWVEYEDTITKTEVVAGCLPIYDRRGTSPKLLGVTCMDINLIASLPTLQKTTGWEDFERAKESASRTCPGSSTGRTLSEDCASVWERQMLADGTASGAEFSSQSRFSLALAWGGTVLFAALFDGF